MSSVTPLYKCNLCGWTGREYLSRDTAMVCPKCFSRQRHRSIFHYLTEQNMLEGSTCLDVASRRILQRRLNYSEYINIDKVKGWADQVMDVSDLQFKDNNFDLIICCSVLQFVPNYLVALEEMCRVLKPTGICIIQIPYDSTINQTYTNNNENSPQKHKVRSENELVYFSYHDFLQQLKKWFNVETAIYKDPNIIFSQQEFFVCKKKNQPLEV